MALSCFSIHRVALKVTKQKMASRPLSPYAFSLLIKRRKINQVQCDSVQKISQHSDSDSMDGTQLIILYYQSLSIINRQLFEKSLQKDKENKLRNFLQDQNRCCASFNMEDAFNQSRKWKRWQLKDVSTSVVEVSFLLRVWSHFGDFFVQFLGLVSCVIFFGPMNSVSLKKQISRDPKFAFYRLIYTQQRMGTTLAANQLVTSPNKAQQLDEKKNALKKQIEKRLFIPGTVYASSEKLLSIQGNEKLETLTKGIIDLVGENSIGQATFLFQIIAKQLKGLLERAGTQNMMLHEFRAYPLAYSLADEFGLAIVYFNLYLEKLPIRKDNSVQEQIVVVCAYRIVGVPDVENQSKINTFLLASAIDNEGERQQVKKEIMSSIKVK